MGTIVKFIPKATLDKIEELGGDPKATAHSIRECEAIWELPIEQRQSAYDALKRIYGDDIAMFGPGLKDDE